MPYKFGSKILATSKPLGHNATMYYIATLKDGSVLASSCDPTVYESFGVARYKKHKPCPLPKMARCSACNYPPTKYEQIGRFALNCTSCSANTGLRDTELEAIQAWNNM